MRHLPLLGKLGFIYAGCDLLQGRVEVNMAVFWNKQFVFRVKLLTKWVTLVDEYFVV